ncbi:PREDICTED: alpha-protein kinase vwkA-like [Amphimedon queenslandica]|uniref:Alpha-type protein kinase domain-containing protein n=1 Tax=Amphimedon queenslandica TaxID=400682 RepID=A0A1X7VQ91_AMPQE|nr:PREDICTED: alpha-protein kinase vwkA-like [Amphimedon queenslandica]|eukprot:XP_019858532.1 PREDICTED: alpha-protein kinase vwkA-like [Amphimedon queenslandica]
MTTFERNPFAEGRFRSAYKGTWTTPDKYGRQCVIKRMRSGAVFTPTAWDCTLKIYDRARTLAQQFNRGKYSNFPVRFTDTFTHTVVDSFPLEYVVVEDFLQGNFLKWCNNYGFISPKAKSEHITMPALVHWSWLYTRGQEMLCDLQGTRDENGYHLTDPVILSLNQSYGETDNGIEGMSMFFMNHECNDICKGWGRPHLEYFIGKIPTETLTACEFMQHQVNNATSYRFEMKFPPAIKDIVTRMFLEIAQA